MKDDFKATEGLTLIELLIVIGIIGILVSVLLPTFSKSRALARSLVCKNHLHQMGLALQMYVDEHQNRFPYYRALLDHTYDASVGADNTGFWWAKLFPYHPLKWTDPAYHCPGYGGAIEGVSQVRGGWMGPYGSYAYNARGVISTWSTNDFIKNPVVLGLGGKAYVKLNPDGRLTGTTLEGQVIKPSEMFAIGESRWKKQGGLWPKGGHDYMQGGMIYVNRGFWAFDPARHGRNYNQLFGDGHISAMSPWVLFNLTNTGALWNYDNQPHREFWPSF
jgi:prepilin-type N-terminal cleavage/methylation domain-containing protein/prepilin-type processing-associated H-X9-DG protein